MSDKNKISDRKHSIGKEEKVRIGLNILKIDNKTEKKEKSEIKEIFLKKEK